MKKQAYPCILNNVKDNHLQQYWVCHGFYGDSFLSSDPEDGVKKWSESELESVWKSKALLLLKKGEHFIKKKDSSKEKWRWIKHLAKEDMTILTVAAYIGLFIAILGFSISIFCHNIIYEYLLIT